MTTTLPLIFTDNAAAKVWELIQEEGNINLKLRVYVTGGGCSGLQYGFTFDEVIQADDMVINKRILTAIRALQQKKEHEEEEEGKEEEGEQEEQNEEEEEEEDGEGEEEEMEDDGEGTDGDGRSKRRHQMVQLLVDPLSSQYLAGAEIDYQEDIEGEQFIIRNPNAKTTCGCGSSFATE